jgi:hypothetical protein
MESAWLGSIHCHLGHCNRPPSTPYPHAAFSDSSGVGLKRAWWKFEGESCPVTFVEPHLLKLRTIFSDSYLNCSREPRNLDLPAYTASNNHHNYHIIFNPIQLFLFRSWNVMGSGNDDSERPKSVQTSSNDVGKQDDVNIIQKVKKHTNFLSIIWW